MYMFMAKGNFELNWYNTLRALYLQHHIITFGLKPTSLFISFLPGIYISAIPTV